MNPIERAKIRMQELEAKETEYMVWKFMQVHGLSIDEVELVRQWLPEENSLIIFPRKKK